MKQTETAVTFEIRIEEDSNFTWQGKLLSRGQIITFKSEMELLLAIDRLLCKNKEQHCQWSALS